MTLNEYLGCMLLSAFGAVSFFYVSWKAKDDYAIGSAAFMFAMGFSMLAGILTGVFIMRHIS